MNTEDLFTDLLNLGSQWKVSEIALNQESETIILKIEDTSEVLNNLVCPRCSNSSLTLKDHSSARTWKHLKLWTYETSIHCRLPRALCKSCRKIWTIKAPWEGKNKHSSKDFEALALTLMRHMPVSKVGQLMNVDDQKLWRILGAYVDEAHEDLDWSEVTRVGVDELSSAKGHKYLSVFVDMQTHAVLYAAEGKDHSVFEDFSTELYLHNSDPFAISEVSMDMSPAYQKGADDYMPNATKVFDHFHVIQNVNKAIGKVCARERRKKGDIRELLKKPRTFQKNEDNLKDEEKKIIEKLKEMKTAMGKAHEMKLSLQDIFRTSSSVKALLGFKTWVKWVRQEAEVEGFEYLLDPMRRVANSINKHLDGIMARWRHGTNNGILEGINSVFSAVKRKARGFRSPQYLKWMLYLTAGKLTGIPDLIPN